MAGMAKTVADRQRIARKEAGPPADPWVRLAAAVVMSAVNDLAGKDLRRNAINLAKSWEAALWLGSDDAGLCLEALGMDTDPVTIVTAPPETLARVKRMLYNFHHYQRGDG